MPWQSWKDRVGQLPRVLAGPILRRVEATSVTIWIALREPLTVTLRVFASDPNEAGALVGTNAAIKLADHLYVVAVTATGPALSEGVVYQYNVYLGAGSGPIAVNGDNLMSTDVLRKGSIGPASLGCGGLPLPSFSLAPSDLNQLRIMHGSCRKPHGGGEDAFQDLVLRIDATATQALERPHLLFLTGDQIYADDVADGLLLMLIDASEAMGFMAESLPGVEGGVAPPPGERDGPLNDAGLSAPLKSHLMRFSEYALMYVMAWSEVLWQAELPTYQQVFKRDPPKVGRDQHEDKDCFDRQEATVRVFHGRVAVARRALANVPTYMIFDDHEISDDWYLDRQWVNKSVSNPLFGRLVQNGLAAYALFQAWGNEPSHFQPGQPGGELLNSIVSWAGAPSSDATGLRARLGMPTGPIAAGENEYPRSTLAVRWHYEITRASYRVVVIDPRTRRSYVGEDDYPALLSAQAVTAQLASLSARLSDEQLLLLILPGPLVAHPALEAAQRVAEHVNHYWLDPEFWGGYPRSFERFLSKISLSAGRIVILSGDVHYGYTTRLRYRATKPFHEKGAPAIEVATESVLAQLTCSACKNEDRWVSDLHEDGEVLGLGEGLPEVVMYGWNNDSEGDLTIGSVAVPRGIATVRRRGHPIVYERRWDFDASSAHWRWKMNFVRADQDRVPEPPPQAVPPPPPGNPNEELKATLTTGRNHFHYKTQFSSGMNAVGRNNLGEVRFDWQTGDAKFVIHRMTWALGEDDPRPMGTFRVNLSLAAETF